jgi:hypothetical protein
MNPYPGTCGSGDLKGKGPNTFTNGAYIAKREAYRMLN